jgi:ribosome biogenesis GTPase
MTELYLTEYFLTTAFKDFHHLWCISSASLSLTPLSAECFLGYRGAASYKTRMNTQVAQQGRVLDVSRRYVTLFSRDHGVVTGRVSSKALELVTGDLVTYELRDGEVFVTGVEPSTHNLYRSYRGTVKKMGANIDLLFVISAVGQVLNPVIIDRMLVAAKIQGIHSVLVVNKSDLGAAALSPLTDVYRSIGSEVLCLSAKFLENFDELKKLIDAPSVRVAALCGVSGVGKSTILNRLVPDAGARTGEVSQRTGQGKQTTTQPRGFLYGPGEDKIIIDFPGVQFFGLSHETRESVVAAFPEFVAASTGCRFGDCKHLQEPECAVRRGLEEGTIAPWRYDSYLQILQEIEDAREY